MWLAKNADPERAAPRGRHYRALRDALSALEGTCRQLAHWREDTRWLKLGIVYAKAMRVAQQNFARQDWLGFKELSALFELGVRRMDELATKRTERVGMILPKRTDWLILPDAKPIYPAMRRVH